MVILCFVVLVVVLNPDPLSSTSQMLESQECTAMLDSVGVSKVNFA